MARGKRNYTAEEKRFQKLLGEHIRKLRLEAAYVQDNFADAAYLDRSSISPMEQGKYDVRLSTLLRVAATLGLRADDLLRQVLDDVERQSEKERP